MSGDVLILKFDGGQTRLSDRELMLAHIVVENEVGRQDNKRWSTCRDARRPAPFHSLPVLVDSSPPPPRTCPDLEVSKLDHRGWSTCRDARRPAPFPSLSVLVDSSPPPPRTCPEVEGLRLD